MKSAIRPTQKVVSFCIKLTLFWEKSDQILVISMKSVGFIIIPIHNTSIPIGVQGQGTIYWLFLTSNMISHSRNICFWWLSHFTFPPKLYILKFELKEKKLFLFFLAMHHKLPFYVHENYCIYLPFFSSIVLYKLKQYHLNVPYPK